MHQADMGKNESPCGLELDLVRSIQLRQHDRAPLACVFPDGHGTGGHPGPSARVYYIT